MTTSRWDKLALTVIAITLGLLTWGPLDLNQALNLTVLVVLAYITGRYAIETAAIAKATKDQAEATKQQAEASRKMAEEMSEQRFDAVRPIIDIDTHEQDPNELMKEGFDAKEGIVPEELPCRLRNIGVGPAVDVYSFIKYLDGEWGQYEFGTLPVGERTEKLRLLLQRRDDRSLLVACYRDVNGRLFESSREVTPDKENEYLNRGPLKIRKLT